MKRRENCTSKELKFALIFMENGILFLHIHEGVQASQKYGTPVEYKSGKQHHGGLTGITNTETLRSSTNVKNNITTALKRSKNMENLRITTLENLITATLTGSKCSRKPTADEYDGLASSQTSILKKSLQNSSLERSCRSQCECVWRLSFEFSPFACSWGLLLP